MTRIAHLSDLHFGTARAALVAALLDDVRAARPACVVVSGDLTQRARGEEFLAARELLRQLRVPRLVVPGNHDLAPLYRPVDRLREPLAAFRALIEPDLTPLLEVGRLALLGLCTPRRLLASGGRVSREQLAHMRACFAARPHAFKVLVAHHPFLSPTFGRHHRLVRRADEALVAADAAGVDMLLAGHFHVNFAGGAHHTSTALRGHTLVVQAGTALSSRTRGEANSYNVIEVDGDEVRVGVRLWDGARFREASADLFRRERGRWARAGGELAGQAG